MAKRPKRQPSNETLDELIGPVCMIADMHLTDDLLDEWRVLIVAARNVKDMHGFHVETMSAE